MSRKSSISGSADLQRRQWLKVAGASVAAGGLALGAARAKADAAPAAGHEGDVLDVAIVGAGLAGLTAARDLRYAGCESFVVLEARDRVGGRTLNYDVGGGYVTEVGGQWIGPGQTAVADLARELEVGTFPSYYTGKTVILGGDGRAEIDLEGTFGTDEAVAAKLSRLSRDVPCGAPWTSPKARELDRLSVGDWLATQGIKAEDRMGWNASISLSGGVAPAKMGLLHFLSMINSADCDYAQLDSIKHSAQETRFVGGSQLLSIRMAQQLGGKVRLSSPVRRIVGWDRDIVTLQTDRGTVRAKKVVMALHPALCHQVRFDPPLPDKRVALQRAWPAHSPARKTAMVYRRPFWRDKGLNGHIFQTDGPVFWAYDNSPPGGRDRRDQRVRPECADAFGPAGREADAHGSLCAGVGRRSACAGVVPRSRLGARRSVDAHVRVGDPARLLECARRSAARAVRQPDLVGHRDREHLGRLHGRRRARRSPKRASGTQCAASCLGLRR